MSSTRHAQPGGPLRQERYASSFESGLLANLVAKRVAVIESAEDRALVWFVQWRSWSLGSMAQLAGSSKMQPEELVELCLAPWREEEGWIPQGQQGLWRCEREALTIAKTAWLASLEKPVETSIGAQIARELHYTRSARTIALIDGAARIGKTFAVRDWCLKSAGLVRYVETPASGDDISFFRAIARSLGVSSSLQMKAAELRSRVEEALSTGDLMLVFDEAHYLWPQSWQRYAMPSRVNWIMTALANRQIPVALITTPQFYTAQRRVEDLTGWASEQFIGRVGHVVRLPPHLHKEDLVAVAKALLPTADRAAWNAVAGYALLSKKHLASVDAIAKRASWLASQRGLAAPTNKDVRQAMKESVMPSDAAVSEALSKPRPRRGQFAKVPRVERGGFAAVAPALPQERARF